MSKNLELFPTEAHLLANMFVEIAAFTVRGVETKKPCPIGLMVVADTTLAKVSGRDGGEQ
jgi:hypothetical protein